MTSSSLCAEEARGPDRRGRSGHFDVIICTGTVEADWLFGRQGGEGAEGGGEGKEKCL